MRFAGFVYLVVAAFANPTAADYDVEQVSWKAAKIIPSYTNYVNRRVWQRP